MLTVVLRRLLPLLTVCTVRGHDPVRRITSVSWSPSGMHRITGSEYFCARCDVVLERPTEGRPRVAIECGQRLWRPACWRRPLLRRFPAGFAFGPVMVWPRGYEVRRG